MPSDMEIANTLINRYLDEIIDEAELAELELLISSDPEIAREFARATRTDTYIYSHFNRAQAEKALNFKASHPASPMRMPLLTPSRRRNLHRGAHKVLEHLVGPVGSTILHVVVIVLLVLLITHNPRPIFEPPIEITMVQDEPKKPFDDIDTLEPTRPDEQESAPALVPFSEESTDESALEIEPDTLVTAEEPPGIILNEIFQNKSPLTLKTPYGMRSEKMRNLALNKYGADTAWATEPAVLKALHWLEMEQSADGSWGPNKVAMTGLGLLTFLAHGETPNSKEYGNTVEHAVRFLVSQQQPDGTFVSINSKSGPYEHAIATYAMAEAYGLTRIGSLKGAMERAVQVILDGQQPGGGWDYKYSKGARRDTSVAGWQIQALKAAQIAGAGNKGIRKALERAGEDLKRARNPATGNFYYTDKSGHQSDAINAIGVLCLQLIGEGDSKEVRQAMRKLAKVECNWDKPPPWALYSWYYITQAKFHTGGLEWKQWNKRFAHAYVKAQEVDGSWSAPDKDEKHYGAVYSTTFAALSLQVYYRVLPTYQVKPSAMNTACSGPSGQDITIAIE